MSADLDIIQLGKTNLSISVVGIGAWSWGDRLFWGYGRAYREPEVQAAFAASLEAGVNWFDTAESYGSGQSERLLGKFVYAVPGQVVVATKFMPYPWRLRRKELSRALRHSLQRLNLPCVDLYQVHWPFPPLPVETWAEGLAEVIEQGLVRAVGVSNYNEEQMRRAYLVLQKHGLHLASNQVEYSLINRKVEFNGLLKVCQDLGVTLIAYSPLGQGVLTGKYSPENPPPGIRGRRYGRGVLARALPLVRLMREIGHAHGSKTPSQVAINWLICKGTVPIPGAKNARQAQDNAGAMGWRLTEAEVAALDEASRVKS